MTLQNHADWRGVTEATRRVMRGNRGKNTRPELSLRRLLHDMGYRFRLHGRELPGTPDIVFGARRAAIQVHGCFWHQHAGCPHAITPRTRRRYWAAKLERNVVRDRETAVRLRAMGWRLLIVWECELADTNRVEGSVREFLGPQVRST